MKVPSNLMSSYAATNSIYRIFVIFLSGTFVAFIFNNSNISAFPILGKEENIDNYFFIVPFIFVFGVVVDSISVFVNYIALKLCKKKFIRVIFVKLFFGVFDAYNYFSYRLWPVMSRELRFMDRIGVNHEELERMATGFVFLEGDDRIFKWVVGHHLIAVLNRHIFILLPLFFVFSVDGWYRWALIFIAPLILAFTGVYWHYYVMMVIFRWCYVKLVLQKQEVSIKRQERIDE